MGPLSPFRWGASDPLPPVNAIESEFSLDGVGVDGTVV